MRGRSRAALLGAAAALTVLAACTPNDPNPEPDPTPSVAPDPLAPGVCLTAGTDDTPNVTVEGLIDCAEPHAFELLARQDVPLEYFDNGTPSADDHARLSRALAGQSGLPLQGKFATYTQAYCTIALQRASGLAEAEFGGRGADRVQAQVMTPALSTRVVLNAGDDWLRQPVFSCIAVVENATGNVSSRLLSDELPLTARQCFTLDAAGEDVAVTCSRPHVGEWVVLFDATSLLEDEQLDAEVARAGGSFTRPVQTILDDACVDALSVLIGEDHDDDVTARAVRGNGWEAESLVNQARCQIVANSEARADLPPGSLIGFGDENVALVPVPN